MTSTGVFIKGDTLLNSFAKDKFVAFFSDEDKDKYVTGQNMNAVRFCTLDTFDSFVLFNTQKHHIFGPAPPIYTHYRFVDLKDSDDISIYRYMVGWCLSKHSFYSASDLILGPLNNMVDLPIWKDEKKLEEIIKRNSSIIKYDPFQEHKSCMVAIDAYAFNIALIRNKTPSLCMEAVKRASFSITKIPKELRTKELIMEAYKGNCRIISTLDADGTLTEDTRVELVKLNPDILELISNQSPNVCKIAVTANPKCIRFVKDKTYELRLLAVEGDGTALQFIDDQTEELCLIAIEEDPKALEFVKEQTVNVCRLAVKICPKMLRLIRDPKIRSMIEQEQHSSDDESCKMQ